jgi:zinc protease
MQVTQARPRLRHPALAGAIACALAFGGLPAVAFAADGIAPPKGVAAGPCVEGLCEYVLENGLRVVLFPDDSSAKVTVNLVYRVGSVHENYGETGMAHLLEHLLFKGTPTHGDIPGEMNKRGIEKNASTSLDWTNYYGTFPANDDTLGWLLSMEADRMVNSFIAKKDLDNEMTVVRNEMEARENDPIGMTLERMRSTAYLWHNYGNDTIGARADVENVPIERLQAFYRTWYRPDNATLVITGRIDPSATLAKVRNSFGPIKRPGAPLPTFYTVEPTQDGEREVNVRRTGDQRMISAVYRAVGATHPDNPPLMVLMDILGDSTSGRLHKALVESKLAADVSAYDDNLADNGLVTMLAIGPKDADAPKIEAELLRQIESIAARPVTDEEVADAKRRIANRFELFMNNANSLAGWLTNPIAAGDWRLVFLRRDRIAAVTAADINRVAKTYLKPSNRTIGRFIPTDAPDRSEIAAAPSAAEALKGYVGKPAVAAGEKFDTSAANIDKRTETFTIGKALKVSLLPKDTRGDRVFFSATFRFGDVASLKSVPPLAASFAGNLLMRGSATMSRDEIAKRFEALNTFVGIDGGPQAASMGLTTRREHFAEALALAAEVLRKPSFPQNEFEQMRLQWTTGMEASRKEPESVASMAMSKRFDPWPADHPFAFRTIDDALAALRALKREDIAAFHRDFYGTTEGEIVVIGDFDPVAVKAQLQALFGDWRSAKPFVEVENKYHAVVANTERFETPDKANAMFIARFNLPLNQEDPDYPALVIANNIFGEDPLKARIADRLRQKDGLSYSAGSSIGFSNRRGDDAGNVTIQAIAAPENMTKLEAAVREELQKFIEQGVTETELRDAVAALTTDREQRRGDEQALTRMLKGNLYLGRTMAWWEGADAKIKALSVADVNAAIRKHFKPDALSVFVAGDFARAAAKTGTTGK